MMELCGGDITKRNWIKWNVTLKDGIDWCKYNLERRYEWVKIISGALEGGDEKKKNCQDPRICAMCKKQCSQRMAEFQMH